jgi:splicing factor U2AF subunit
MNNGGISFRSFEEERDWVIERRRKRLARKSKFDHPPTAQQLATDAAVLALSNPAATDFAGIPSDRNFSAVPQQTRHARRLYIGHLPPNVTEQELHVFFRSAVEQALVDKPLDGEDPILSVYINHERRFCFLEFKTVEMATACMELDGIDIHGKGKVKVKRPNDYNPAMAPKVHPSAIPVLDVSRLGIISGTVQDGPSKVFIGGKTSWQRSVSFCYDNLQLYTDPSFFLGAPLVSGLHYHLTEDQVLELLQAFGKVKAFHLVKNEPDSLTSKGYCFVEFADQHVTPVAVIGLNGMDLGGGKVLTARVAGERSGGMIIPPTIASTSGASVMPHQPAAPRADAIIIDGYDVEVLVDAAMGIRPMPTAPMHIDQFGVPITRTPAAPILTLPVAANPGPAVTPLPPGVSALDIANAALDAAMGNAAGGPPPPPTRTRILVLLNMVTDDDLATTEDYQGLKEEVQEECAKFGNLLGMNIPRSPSGSVQPSAIRKIFLEYGTVQDAANAERELAGRQFGPNVVEVRPVIVK